MSWDLRKCDLMLLEYMSVCILFGMLGYDDDSIHPTLSGTSFGVKVIWQGKSAEVRIGSVGDMTVGQLQEKLLAMIEDWNQYATQTERDQIWQVSETKRRAEDILHGLALIGFPHLILKTN